MAYINHYSLGGGVVDHKGKKIFVADRRALVNYLTSLGNTKIEIGVIPPGYAHRPDLISDLFYGTVTKDWMILMFNNIKDPFQELNAGDEIFLPMI